MTETLPNPLVLDPTGADIQGEAARIRERGPITPVELLGGVRAWSVTDATILKELLIDSRVSKDARQHWPKFINGEIPQDWPLFTWVAVANMFTAYGTDHKRLRKLVAPAFTKRRTDAMREQIERITEDLLTTLAQTPAGESVDLREEFAYSLPIRVISELMGVPESLNPGLRGCVDGIFDTSLTPEQSQANYMEMYRILGELVAYRRDNPGDDMTSLLVSHRDADDGSQLTEQELVDTLLLVISAGHETTVNLLDQAIYLLLTRPEQRAALTENRATWTDVVEETLRYEAPVAHLPLRYAVDDIEIAGVHIAKGDPILACYAAANRDPKIHGSTADDFDVTRKSKDHLSFGYGAHLCLGAPLARLEAHVALPALFERFPNMRLAADPSELGAVPSFISNGHQRLPAYLTGGPATGA
ncbi:cytochrome P450 [Nocardia uniformis]|uniref:Cytochrome P450 n=1 Tax=Nocardia uniformis TaxID=53432 RepID=A0A849C138_9NOCA|nr:cytochrome P450 [Nocardia uniformis]NNH72442.1 cytochrome P450 [Nocardia uniformis]